jgi:hypothetical protein
MAFLWGGVSAWAGKDDAVRIQSGQAQTDGCGVILGDRQTQVRIT